MSIAEAHSLMGSAPALKFFYFFLSIEGGWMMRHIQLNLIRFLIDIGGTLKVRSDWRVHLEVKWK